jgi:hypothetical protein
MSCLSFSVSSHHALFVNIAIAEMAKPLFERSNFVKQTAYKKFFLSG